VNKSELIDAIADSADISKSSAARALDAVVGSVQGALANGGLIEGCQKVISLMKINDKWRVYIDPSMAYGDEGRPGIPSNSILVFDIELLDIQ
jgi:hypothetical protein